MTLLSKVGLAFVALLLSFPAGATSLPQPAGEVVLTVSGNVGVTNGADSAEFDMDMLAALPQREITTYTPWTEGEIEFEGVTVSALMDAVAASGETVTAAALNDYEVEIPFEDLTGRNALIAIRMNGEPMSVREKGPLWIVYPVDAPEDLSRTMMRTMVWQLRRIGVE